MTPVSHIVGPALTINSASRGLVRRQRCLWCGAIIDELELDHVAVQLPADGSPPAPPGTWEAGAVVRIVGDNPRMTSVVEIGPDQDLPEDSCTTIDYAVTR